MVSKLVFPNVPVSVYPVADFLHPEHHRHRRGITPVPRTPATSLAKERAASALNSADEEKKKKRKALLISRPRRQTGSPRSL